MGDAGTVVPTGSSEIASHGKKLKNKATPDMDDNNEEKTQMQARKPRPRKVIVIRGPVMCSSGHLCTVIGHSCLID